MPKQPKKPTGRDLAKLRVLYEQWQELQRRVEEAESEAMRIESRLNRKGIDPYVPPGWLEQE